MYGVTCDGSHDLPVGVTLANSVVRSWKQKNALFCRCSFILVLFISCRAALDLIRLGNTYTSSFSILGYFSLALSFLLTIITTSLYGELSSIIEEAITRTNLSNIGPIGCQRL